MTLFRLCYGNYDSEMNFFFNGPDSFTENDFQNLCNSLVKSAAKIAYELNGNTWGKECFEEKNINQNLNIGWDSIVHVLVYSLLPQHGFQLTEIPTAKFSGPGIIWMDGDDPENLIGDFFPTIVKYNNDLFHNKKEK